jgi:hypothetical protein
LTQNQVAANLLSILYLIQVKLSPSSRLLVALLALFSMLFMQLAAAACGCVEAGTGPDAPHVVISATHHGGSMPCCAGLDKAQSKLCKAQHHGDKQALDTPELVHVPEFIPAGLAQPMLAVEAAHSSPPPDIANIGLARATAPPLAIRHCCFRV